MNSRVYIPSLALGLLLVVSSALAERPLDQEPSDGPPSLGPRVTSVAVNNGSAILQLPPELGGGSVMIEDGLRGCYLRKWNGRGDAFEIESIALWLPSLQLPLPSGLMDTGPIKVSEALGGFDESLLLLAGAEAANAGRLDAETGTLREVLGLQLDFPLLGELPDEAEPVRLLLQKTEFGYDPLSGASESWEASGLVVEGAFAGAEVSSEGDCKSADYAFPICTPRRISTGFGSFVTRCRVSPAAVATCTVSNLGGAGGVLVHCQQRGLANVTITYTNPKGRKRKTVSVWCD